MSQTWGKWDAFESLTRSVFMLSWEREKRKDRFWGRWSDLAFSRVAHTHTYREKKEIRNTFLGALRQICRLQGRGYVTQHHCACVSVWWGSEKYNSALSWSIQYSQVYYTCLVCWPIGHLFPSATAQSRCIEKKTDLSLLLFHLIIKLSLLTWVHMSLI